MSKMDRLSSKQWVIISITATIFLLVGLPVVVTFNNARHTAEESAQLALFAEVVLLLEESHQLHGKYPNSLESLPLTYPDGGDQSTLALLRYESDGRSYSLATKGTYSSKEYEETR